MTTATASPAVEAVRASVLFALHRATPDRIHADRVAIVEMAIAKHTVPDLIEFVRTEHRTRWERRPHRADVVAHFVEVYAPEED